MKYLQKVKTTHLIAKQYKQVTGTLIKLEMNGDNLFIPLTDEVSVALAKKSRCIKDWQLQFGCDVFVVPGDKDTSTL